MKQLLRIGYFFVFTALAIVFFLEYQNYFLLKQTVTLKDYSEQLERISDKRDTILLFHETVDDPAVVDSIDYCYRWVKDMDFLRYDKVKTLNHIDIKNLDGMGECDFKSSSTQYQPAQYKYNDNTIKSPNFYKLLCLGNKQSINETFEIMLDRAEIMMTSFVDSINYYLSTGEINV